MKEDECVYGLCGRWPFRFQNYPFMGQLFCCVPSLNVVTNDSLGFIPFLIICCDIKK